MHLTGGANSMGAHPNKVLGFFWRVTILLSSQQSCRAFAKEYLHHRICIIEMGSRNGLASRPTSDCGGGQCRAKSEASRIRYWVIRVRITTCTAYRGNSDAPLGERG